MLYLQIRFSKQALRFCQTRHNKNEEKHSNKPLSISAMTNSDSNNKSPMWVAGSTGIIAETLHSNNEKRMQAFSLVYQKSIVVHHTVEGKCR